MEEKSLNHNSKKSSNSGNRKIVVSILVVLILIVGGALVYKFMEANRLEKKNIATQSQLDQAYDELDSMSNELDTRILKIAQLGGEIDTLLQIKTTLEEEKRALRTNTKRQISNLNSKVSGYKELLVAQDQEIARLKMMNDSLYNENKGLKVEANELNESIRNLSKSKTQLEEKVAVASKLKVEGMKVVAVNSSGKERSSPFKNRHIDHLNIQFDIKENRVAPIEGKGILVKVIGPDKNVIFDVASGSGSFVYEGRESFYTIKKDILFDRNSQTLTFLYNKGSDYDLGKHIIEVYTDDYQMGSDYFIVK